MKNYNTPKIRMRDLFEAKVHLGHQTHLWNPKMAPYLFGIRNKTHIINLEQTIPYLRRALNVVKEIVKNDGKILFLGTRNDLSNIVTISAKRCGQPYMTNNWISGTLTNWKEIYPCLERLKIFEEMQENNINLSISEFQQFKRLKTSFEGIKNLSTLPDALFVVDTNLHKLAIKEAVKSNIPTIGILDSNCDPENITYPIPGNDDSLEAIHFYYKLMSDSILEGMEKNL